MLGNKARSDAHMCLYAANELSALFFLSIIFGKQCNELIWVCQMRNETVFRCARREREVAERIKCRLQLCWWNNSLSFVGNLSLCWRFNGKFCEFEKSTAKTITIWVINRVELNVDSATFISGKGDLDSLAGISKRSLVAPLNTYAFHKLIS